MVAEAAALQDSVVVDLGIVLQSELVFGDENK
jgi:hypothetical protein